MPIWDRPMHHIPTWIRAHLAAMVVVGPPDPETDNAADAATVERRRLHRKRPCTNAEVHDFVKHFAMRPITIKCGWARKLPRCGVTFDVHATQTPAPQIPVQNVSIKVHPYRGEGKGRCTFPLLTK